MLTRFDIMLIVLIAYFADELIGSRIPHRTLLIAILIILVVLLVLGVVRV